MKLISIETDKINLDLTSQIGKVEMCLRGQKLEQITDQMIVRQINHKQKVNNGEIAKPLPYYGNSLPLITRAGEEIYELRMQTVVPAFNLISLPQYRILKKEGYDGVFSLGSGFNEAGMEILDLLMLQLFTNQKKLIENTRVVVKESFEIIKESPSKIFGINQYLFSANAIK